MIGTGLDSFSNPSQIGALFPFQGYELVFVAVAAALWLLWHVGQIIQENREYGRALRFYRKVGLVRVLHFSGGERVATVEDIERVEAEIAATPQQGTAQPHSGATAGEGPDT